MISYRVKYMKNFKLFILVLAISVSTASFATTTSNENPKEDPKSELRQQIIDILGKTVNQIDENKIKAEVVFTLNNKSEIVIISVNSKNENVDRFVKGRLNYKKVKVKTLNEGKIYHMPLTIVNE